MYSEIKNTSLSAFDVNTGKFIGEARFTPTKEAKKALLDWINYGISPQHLLMENSQFEPSENYVPLIPNQTYPQRGIFSALLKRKDNNEWMPVEIFITYNWKLQAVEPGNFIRSIELDHVKILKEEAEKIELKKNNSRK